MADKIERNNTPGAGSPDLDSNTNPTLETTPSSKKEIIEQQEETPATNNDTAQNLAQPQSTGNDSPAPLSAMSDGGEADQIHDSESLREVRQIPQHVHSAYQLVYDHIRSMWTSSDDTMDAKKISKLLSEAHETIAKGANSTEFEISEVEALRMVEAIQCIKQLLKHRKKERQPWMDLLKSTMILLNHFRHHDLRWKDMMQAEVRDALLSAILERQDPKLGILKMVETALIQPAEKQVAHMHTFNNVTTLMNAKHPSAYLDALHLLDVSNGDMAFSVNEQAKFKKHDCTCPMSLISKAIEGKKDSDDWKGLIYCMHLYGVNGFEDVGEWDGLDDNKLATIRRLILTGETDADYRRYKNKLDLYARSLHPAPPESPPESPTNPNSDFDMIDSIENDEDPDAEVLHRGPAEYGGDSDDENEEELLFHLNETSYPKDSRTVAWGKSGGGKWYLNRLGPAAIGIYREQDVAIDHPDDDVDWDSPPMSLCVTNPSNRLGELRNPATNKFKYTKRHIVGIYGVSFNATKRPFGGIPESQEYEYINTKRYDDYNKNIAFPGKKKRFIGCHVRVGWREQDGTVTKSWELRGALRASTRWKQELADKAIYEAAKAAQERFNRWRGGHVEVSSRDATPADAVEYALKGREKSLGFKSTPSPILTSRSALASPVPQRSQGPSMSSRYSSHSGSRASTPMTARTTPELVSRDERLKYQVFQGVLRKYNVDDIEDLPADVRKAKFREFYDIMA
ncbi:hypothetical protein EJ04DRAFT_591161 [Polyplosphaeria fusca]|uniref:Uncharacterized protein n=1 Tax=Polyplosphaeria fusca TaxID=682080 RepID=A0A9P4QPE4_9PLEO|nr:hypothetical protein EJ04DRAFT_591161 [Polyplosphaeria fusca]